MKVGWLVDRGLPRAGMILSVEAFAAACPGNYTLIPCPAHKRPPDDVDAFILHGDLYNHRWAEVIGDKPLMAHRHGGWIAGDPRFRRWVLDHASLITFNSPKQRSLFRYKITAPVDFVPLPVDVSRFIAAASMRQKRQGTFHLGLIMPAKGISYTVDWAMRNSRRVDFYGEAPHPGMLDTIAPPSLYFGPVGYEGIPTLMANYADFVFMPHEDDLYARVVVEAHASGCNLILRGDEEALWNWLDLDACQEAPQIFWEKFEGIL